MAGPPGESCSYKYKQAAKLTEVNLHCVLLSHNLCIAP